MHFPWSGFRKYGVPVEVAAVKDYPALPNMDGRTRELFEQHIRRGIPIARLQKDGERTNFYMSPRELLGYRYEPGQLLIGKVGGTFIGHEDDRPITTIAGTRAGKTTTILEPNLYLYGGSMLVLDPKGELAAAANFRRLAGHAVHVLDPSHMTGGRHACFNPLDELEPDSLTIVDDVLAVAAALVPDTDGGGNAKHFNNSARTLIAGIIFITLTLPKRDRHLVTVRELLCLTYPPLVGDGKRLAAEALASASKEEKKRYFDANAFAMIALLNRMRNLKGRFARAAAGIANRLNYAAPTEKGSIFSTAAVNTDFIDSLTLQQTLRRSDFRLADLRGDQPMTLFLCLPVSLMETHARWLRLIVQLACRAFEKQGPFSLGRQRCVFMLEEFAALGYMPFFEKAAAYYPGMGIKPWFVVQDVTQLKSTYKATWESFLGNSGLVQVFANGDGETLDYVTKRLGKLIAPWEFEQGFAREHESQLLLMKGKAPAVASRPSFEDVARIRDRAHLH